MSNQAVCQACGQESGNERHTLDKIARLEARKKRDKLTILALRAHVKDRTKAFDGIGKALGKAAVARKSGRLA